MNYIEKIKKLEELQYQVSNLEGDIHGFAMKRFMHLAERVSKEVKAAFPEWEDSALKKSKWYCIDTSLWDHDVNFDNGKYCLTAFVDKSSFSFSLYLDEFLSENQNVFNSFVKDIVEDEIEILNKINFKELNMYIELEKKYGHLTT